MAVSLNKIPAGRYCPKTLFFIFAKINTEQRKYIHHSTSRSITLWIHQFLSHLILISGFVLILILREDVLKWKQAIPLFVVSFI